jgi:isocitrate lyase
MDLTSILAVIGIPGIAIICWAVTQVAAQWRKAKVAEYNAALKQQMIERGMSADEIVRVLGTDHDQGRAAPGGRMADPLQHT